MLNAHIARSLRWLTAISVAAALGPRLQAQEFRWQIPSHGAEVYRRDELRFEVTPPASKFRPEVVVMGGASAEPHRWRYLTTGHDNIPAGCEKELFDDSQWLIGPASFGPDVGSNALHRTPWRTDVVHLRTKVDLGKKAPKALRFLVDHDDGVRIWLNGAMVVADDGYGKDRSYVVSGAALDAWHRGDNVLAARCTNIGGAQYFDVQVEAFAQLPRELRRAEDLTDALREEREASNRVRRDLFAEFRPAPVLLQGELDASNKFVPWAPTDLRDLAWWVAADLRCGALGGAVALDAQRVYQFGDLKVRGRATAVDPEGWQELDVTVKTTKEPAANSDSNRFLDRFVKPYVRYGFDGTLKIRRRIEPTAAGVRVNSFESSLTGELTQGKNLKDAVGTVHHQERWQWQHEHENQDADFRLMVKRAIDKGTAKLRDQLKNVGAPTLRNQGPDGGDSYHSGRLAIACLALIKGGVPLDDEVLARALNELRQRPLIDTYSLGNAMMAIEALYIPHSEVSALRDGSIDRPSKRTPSDSDRVLLQRWTDRLMTNIDTRVDPGYLLRFNYTGGDRYDNSVNQYGLLGLYSAHLCGIEVPSTVWESAANHLLDCQADWGERVSLELVDYRTRSRQLFDPDATVTIARSTANANGWSYMDTTDNGEHAEVWGSMTCAGITGLAICQGALNDFPKLKRAKLQSDASRARADGFAWLAQNMSVRHHPGDLTRRFRWFYYYLYGLERASLLSGVALIQGRDWYFEGAMMLVLAQRDDGDWPAELSGDDTIERNAMAILFLKQSTSPVLTGK